MKRKGGGVRNPIALQRRLKSLERVFAEHARGFFMVTFQNGEKRKVQPDEVISYLLHGEVTEIDGDTGNRNGLLVELLRGLLDE
jgi:hypothetical protein